MPDRAVSKGVRLKGNDKREVSLFDGMAFCKKKCKVIAEKIS